MSERVAIVAGAGGDLGLVTAQKLAAAGFTVAGVDRSDQVGSGRSDLPTWSKERHSCRRQNEPSRAI